MHETQAESKVGRTPDPIRRLTLGMLNWISSSTPDKEARGGEQHVEGVLVPRYVPGLATLHSSLPPPNHTAFTQT